MPTVIAEKPNLMDTLRECLGNVKTWNDTLNDPRRDGSGIDAKSPDGDDYNEVLSAIEPLFALIEPTALDPLQVAIDALRVIYAGASVTGRWIDDSCEECGQDEAEPCDGFYDRDKPPAGYDADGYCGFDDDRPDPVEPLKPATWEAYNGEEQDAWLYTCADQARHALATIGVPVTAGEG